MKKYISGFIGGLIVAFSVSVFAASQFSIAGFKIFVNGNEYKNADKPAVVIDGSTYLPLRALGETLGTKVNWNVEKKQVEIGEPPREAINIEPKEVKLIVNGTTIEPDLRNNLHYYVCFKDGYLMINESVTSHFITMNSASYPAGTEYKFAYQGYRFTMTEGQKSYIGKKGKTDLHVPVFRVEDSLPWFEAEVITNETGIKIELDGDTLWVEV